MSMNVRRLFVNHRLLMLLSIIIASLSLSIFGCQSSVETHSDIQLEWEVTPNPPSVGQATLNITLRDSTNELLTGANVNIEGNMSHPGMRPVIAEAEETEPGIYSAPIEFGMGGDWFFIIESTLPDDRIVEWQINIPRVSSQE